VLKDKPVEPAAMPVPAPPPPAPVVEKNKTASHRRAGNSGCRNTGCCTAARPLYTGTKS
jgi:hypothetical protein